MARYNPLHTGLKLLPVDFDQPVIPGRVVHALCHLVDHELDLTAFHSRYKNDDDGAPAFDPHQQHPVSLQPRYHQQSQHGTGLPRERAVHRRVG